MSEIIPAPDAPIDGLHAEKIDEIILVRVDQVELGERLREIDLDWADALAAIMQRDGQRDPIDVCRLPGRTTWTLGGAGGHRLTGAKRAGMVFIKAVVVTASRAERRMREVQDNLMRRDLDPFDRASFIAELVSLKRAAAGLNMVARRDRQIDPRFKRPSEGNLDTMSRSEGNVETISRLGDAASNKGLRKRIDDEAKETMETISNVYGWSEEVGEQLGFTGRTIRNDLMIFRGITPSLMAQLRAARHPAATNATQLRALAKLDATTQRTVVDLLTSPGASLNYGQPKTVGDAIKHPLGPKPDVLRSADSKRQNTILATLKRMGTAELLGLFQSPAFHGLMPPQARALLAPMRVAGEQAAVVAIAASQAAAAQTEKIAQPTPAVPIRQSVKPDYLVCLECGGRVQRLAAHLRKHAVKPADYRTKWQLPLDYPMTAPNIEYAAFQAKRGVNAGAGQ